MDKNRFYNDEVKQAYLQTFQSEDVKEVIGYMFDKSKSSETLYEKDLHSFSLQQIEMLMKNINPTTINSATNTKSRINQYILWAINNGQRASNINPLDGTPSDWQNRFIDKTAKRYLSNFDIIEIVDELNNFQDKALIQCIFEGILGVGMSEILSLSIENVNTETREVKVYSERDKKWRKVKVSEKCIYLITKAYEERYYTSEGSDISKELIEKDGKVFKVILWKSTRKDEVDAGSLTKRLYNIKNYYDIEEFSMKTISKSGEIKMAADILKNKGELGKEEFHAIGEQFNLRKTRINGYEYHNTTLMKHYINDKNLKVLYDMDVTI